MQPRRAHALVGLVLGIGAALGSAAAQTATPSADDARPGLAIAPPAFGFLANPPAGLPTMPQPAGYQPTAAMFELGQRLFHDAILSHDRTVSCATCHPAATGFASAEPLPLGIGGQRALRHAPALWNRGYGPLQRWDGGAVSLEQFVLEPIADAREMGSSVAAAVQRLGADADYRQAFAATFGGAPEAQGLQQALATFVRGIVRGDGPYDRFLRGEVDALTKEERAGQWVFESKGQCWRCHTPPLFTDERFHNTGVGVRAGVPEAGRMARTGEPSDLGKWKTPTLRGVRHTAPFMHDGSQATLRDVVDFYARGGVPNDQLSPHLRPIELSEADRRHLVAFLMAL